MSDRLRAEAAEAVGRASTEGAASRPAVERSPLPAARGPVDPKQALEKALGPKAGNRAHRQLLDAADAFAGERFDEARRTLKPLVARAGEVPELRELHGLSLYRMERWAEAAEELEVFRVQTGSTEQHPVLMDCYRALGHWADVDELWRELGDASPSGALVTEGRIVHASTLADRGRVADGIRVLSKGWKLVKRPADHHLRRAYALADLYERSGATPRARQLFSWIASHDADFADVRFRLRSLD